MSKVKLGEVACEIRESCKEKEICRSLRWSTWFRRKSA